MNYNKYLTIVAVVLLLFGGSILPPELSKILSNPIVKFGLIYWFIYMRVKNYYHALYITLFVALCLSIVGYLESEPSLEDDEE